MSWPQLRGLPERPGLIILEAQLIAAGDCGPCPAHALCQPCVSTTVIAERGDARGTSLKGRCADLVAGRRYRFLVRLEPGYGGSLDQLGNDPRQVRLGLEACEPADPR